MNILSILTQLLEKEVDSHVVTVADVKKWVKELVRIEELEKEKDNQLKNRYNTLAEGFQMSNQQEDDDGVNDEEGYTTEEDYETFEDPDDF